MPAAKKPRGSSQAMLARPRFAFATAALAQIVTPGASLRDRSDHATTEAAQHE
jgi:hypothetical protein